MSRRDLNESYPAAYLQSLRGYIEEFLKQKNPKAFLGEFLDDEARRGVQFGLGGTSFLLHLARHEEIQTDVTVYAEKVLLDALTKLPQHRTTEERQLTKDLGRIASKTIVALLFSDKSDVQQKILEFIFSHGVADGLVKLVFDDPTIHAGDPVTTAYFLHVLHVSNAIVPDESKAALVQMQQRVYEQLLSRPYSLMTKLLLSSALCLHDYSKYIDTHLRLLNSLYRQSQGYTDVLASDSPFIDRFYEDSVSPKAVAKNRYVRVLKGYVVLISIYIAVLDEKEYFRFPMTKAIIAQIDLPYENFVQGDKCRSAVYYIFFLYISLRPQKYLHFKKLGFFDKAKLFIRNRLAYHLGNLTLSGQVLVIIVVIALITLGVEVHEGGGSFAEIVKTFEVLIAALLGLTETKKR